MIKLNNVSKIYTINFNKPTLVDKIFNTGGGEKYAALSNINLNINNGENIGIIGKNGSGKTTLLKIITGITSPTSGNLTVAGKLVSLIDLQAGFQMELSGRDNIYLNGLIIGMRLDEINNNFNKIIKFSGLGKFIEAPIRTYSEGMRLRLGFSVAIFSDPEIMILDEGIATADKDFLKKSLNKLNELFHQNKTVLMASHELNFLKTYCTRILWLENGKIKRDGGLDVLDEYQSSRLH